MEDSGYSPRAGKLRWVCLAAALGLLASGCGEGTTPAGAETSLPPFDTDACQALDSPAVTPNAYATGPVNNALVVHGGFAWVVQSGANTIGRLELASGAWDPEYVDVGNERNPWDLAVDRRQMFVSNYLSGSVSVVDPASGTVESEIMDERLISPAGVALSEDKAFIASSGFVGPGYVDAEILVIDRASLAVDAVLSVSGRNLLHLHWDDEREVLYAVSGGETVFGDDGTARPGTDGVLDAFDGGTERRAPLRLPLLTERPYAGAPGDLVVDGPHGYLPSRTSSDIYKVDLARWEVLRGTNDPIEAYLGTGNQLTSMTMAGPGRAYVTAFNLDRVFVFDTECDASVAGPTDVGKGEFLEGPLDIAYDPDAGRAYTILSLSNAIAVIADP